MNSADVKRRLSLFDVALGVMKSKLEEARKVEGKRQQLLELVKESDLVVSYLAEILEDLKVLNTVVGKEEVAFKKRRLAFLESSITDQLDSIFPKKKLHVAIDCNFDRYKTKLRLNIVDSNNNVRPPSKTEGKLAQQLISVTSAYGCVKLLGKNILYMDEPFSNSSEDNLIKLQKLLNRFVVEGFQVILIAQSPLLFADIERRLILLRSRNGIVVDHVDYQDIDHLAEEE